MRMLTCVSMGLSMLAGPALAQSTTNCEWIGNVWTCNQSNTSSGIDWGILERSKDSYNDSVQRGAELGAQISRARAERERAEAEADLYRAQAEAARRQPQAGQAAPNADYQRLWFEKARPRMGLYSDFADVVYADDVNISPDMVMLMSSSDYAADIAYYLGTHKAESTAISKLPLLEAARAIDDIEARLAADNVKSAAED